MQNVKKPTFPPNLWATLQMTSTHSLFCLRGKDFTSILFQGREINISACYVLISTHTRDREWRERMTGQKGMGTNNRKYIHRSSCSFRNYNIDGEKKSSTISGGKAFFVCLFKSPAEERAVVHSVLPKTSSGSFFL